MKVLELFAGSRSIGRMAESLGCEVFSIDWEAYDNIDLQIDVEELKISDVPFIPDVIWASPDCTTYSIAAVSKHRRDSVIPISDYAVKSDNVNQHFISLIKEWQTINPNLKFYIENPRGMLRRMPFMAEFTRHTVWYCQYGDDRAKPTDIWTNDTNWIPRPVCHNYKYDKEGNIIDKHCHHQSARRGAVTGTQGISCTYDKSRIPDQLCEEILKSGCKINQ